MKTTTIEALVIRETAKAYMLRICGCTSDAWVPKSQLEHVQIVEEPHDDGYGSLRHLTAAVPVWLWNKLPLRTADEVPYATRPW